MSSASAFSLHLPTASNRMPAGGGALSIVASSNSVNAGKAGHYQVGQGQGTVGVEQTKKRAPVRCGICGQRKKGHICTGPPPMSNVPLHGPARRHHGFDHGFDNRLKQRATKKDVTIVDEDCNLDFPPTPPQKDDRDALQHPVVRMYNAWATDGRDVVMECCHAVAFDQIWQTLEQTHEKFRPDMKGQSLSFTAIDAGCGNGWAARKIAQNPRCESVVGIDAAARMIDRARSLTGETPGANSRVHFCVADLEIWKPARDERADLALLCETLYFCQDPAAVVENIVRNGLKADGVLAASLECYHENALSRVWGHTLGVPVHCKSEREWRGLFEAAGLSQVEVWTWSDNKTFLPNKHSLRQGTLLIVGKKGAKPPTSIPARSCTSLATGSLSSATRSSETCSQERSSAESSSSSMDEVRQQLEKMHPPPPPRKATPNWASMQRRSRK